MTAIAAILTSGQAPCAQLGAMMNAMQPRIRDDSAVWSAGGLALGAAVLHTTAESLETAQPHTNHDASLALVMDGYLTNWEELRCDLLARGAKLRNRSDAELVLCAYEQWGEQCAARIEGEFAFIIADQRARRLYAARDHQGLRPLYHYRDGNTVLLASDLAAIMAAAQRKPELNQDYLAVVASGQWYLHNATVWQGIERVPQAHWMSFAEDQPDRPVQRQYYQLPVEVTQVYRREEDYVEHYRAMLFDAVRRTARSHRPLAITVSGGLDSSAIFSIADELEKAGDLPAPGLQGYTLAGDEGTRAYELPFARAAADHCGRSLIEVPLFRPGADWFTAQAQRDCDVPIPQNGAMSRNLELAAHANGSRVILHGDGGDQWLDGSLQYYHELALAGDLVGFARALRRDAQALGWGAAVPKALRIGGAAFVPDRMRRAANRRRIERLYADPQHVFWMLPERREQLRALHQYYLANLPADPRARSKLARLFSPYRELALDFMQRQRAQSGVETREPMQTRQFIEFSATTPEWTRRQAGLTKVVHRKAMAALLPEKIITRLTKADFGAPALLEEFARSILEQDQNVLRGLCDHRAISQLTGTKHNIRVDPHRGWEVWGLYAVTVMIGLTAPRCSGLSGQEQD
jgi:asparagine synthase (glutamine-hydrolysing)